MHGQRSVADPGEPVVPVPLATGLLGQSEGGRGDRRAGGLVSEQFEPHRQAGHHLPPPALIGLAAQPTLPETSRYPRPAGRARPDAAPEAGFPRIRSRHRGRSRLLRIVKTTRSPSPTRSQAAPPSLAVRCPAVFRMNSVPSERKTAPASGISTACSARPLSERC